MQLHVHLDPLAQASQISVVQTVHQALAQRVVHHNEHRRHGRYRKIA